MLSVLWAHAGRPPMPHDIWSRWSVDPLLVSAILVIAACYWSGCRRTDTPLRRVGFLAGLAVLVLALVSPLDALSEALASAHMAQHLLIGVVAPLLLVASRPSAAMRRAIPGRLRFLIHQAEKRTGSRRFVRDTLLHPAVAWLGFAAALWAWHAERLYELALSNTAVHRVEHASFFLAGLGVWSAIRTSADSRRSTPPFGLLFVFTLGLQSTLLAALMTFSTRVWYSPYLDTTRPWGLDPLTDQQLAGLLMWFPMTLLYLGAVLWLLRCWLTPPLGSGGMDEMLDHQDDVVVKLGRQ